MTTVYIQPMSTLISGTRQIMRAHTMNPFHLAEMAWRPVLALRMHQGLRIGFVTVWACGGCTTYMTQALILQCGKPQSYTIMNSYGRMVPTFQHFSICSRPNIQKHTD